MYDWVKGAAYWDVRFTRILVFENRPQMFDKIRQ